MGSQSLLGPAGRRLLAVAGCVVVGGACACAAGARQSGQRADESIADGIMVDANHNGLGNMSMFLFATSPNARGKQKAILVAQTRTDDSGSFELDASDSAALEQLARSNGGWLNLDYVGGLRTLHVYRSLARKFQDGQWIGTEDAGFSPSVGEVMLAPGAPGVEGKKPARRMAANEAVTACTETYQIVGQKTIVTTIGELHTTDTNAKLRYGPTADSTIDALVSWDSGATWSPAQVGPTHVANTLGSAITQSAGASYNRQARSGFVYEKIRYVNTCFGEHYLLKAVKWAGASYVGGVAPDPTKHCANVAATNVKTFTTSFARTANSAGKYAAAASLAPLGVAKNVGAVSGYSGNLKATWSASGGTHRLCGDTTTPDASKHIFAG